MQKGCVWQAVGAHQQHHGTRAVLKPATALAHHAPTMSENTVLEHNKRAKQRMQKILHTYHSDDSASLNSTAASLHLLSWQQTHEFENYATNLKFRI